MGTNALILLIILQFTHWAADYTHLSTDEMLAAKRLGKDWVPILNHATVHCFLVSVSILPFLFPQSPLKWVLLSYFQFGTHFAIDVLKGRCNGWFPSIQSPANRYHWYVFGFDQLLHQVVLILIVYYTFN